MASIQSLGIGSGLLTSELVEQIVEAERAASDLRLEADTAEVEAEISAYAELRTVLESVQSSISSLAVAATIQSSSASSSNESVVTATTSSIAEPGSYRIEVDEVATAHSLASKQYSSVDDTVGAGILSFRFGTTSYDGSGNYDSFSQADDTTLTTITIDASNNTLAGVRDAINTADFGVSASVVYDGTGYRLLLTSDETGEQSSMEISVSGDAGLQALAYNSAQNDASSNMQETQKGVDASLRVNGLSVTSASNSLDAIISGVTLNVTEASTSAVTLTVSRDVDDIADRLEGFVEAYNDYKTIYDQLSEYDVDEDLPGILMGDSVLRSVHLQMRASMTSIVSGLTGADYTSLIDIGISTDQTDDFNLVFDRTAFEEAMQEDAQSIVGLLASDTSASDSQVDFFLSGTNTEPGTYAVNITQVATQGTYQGLSTSALAFSSEVVISDVNDSLSVNLNGTTKAVALQQGSYSSGDELGLMIQNAINSSFTSDSVTVAFDATNLRFDMTSSEFGSSSEVAITAADAMVANTLGLVTSGSGQAVGSYYATLNDASFGATTPPAEQSVAESDSFDLSASPVNFDLTLSGTSADGTYAITLNENWADVLDVDGNITTDRDRSDLLTYIQSELNDAGLAGVVSAAFNSSNRLIFTTPPAAGTQTISISNTAVTGADYLGISDGSATSGVSIASGTEFELTYSNRYGTLSSGTIAIGSGIYETAEDLAQQIENQINADAAISAGAKGAMTESGSRSLATTIDFTADEAQFGINLNGTDYTINVTANGSDNLDSIQSAIDAAVGAGVLTASLDNNGLVLTSVATGSAQTLEVTSDGIGASTAAGTVDLSTGVDFSATPASFSLLMDGFAIDVTLDGDGTTGTNDGAQNLDVIQEALDTALLQANGGGEFAAGDIVAKLNASNQLYFETVAKNGVATEATFGADASIQITAADANTNSALGISAGSIAINGYDSLGLDKGQYSGFDSAAKVSYQQDSEGDGRFVIAFDNSTAVTLSNVSLTATTQLGFAAGSGTDTSATVGVDVAGTINGIAATGSRQYLTASDGIISATNGYLLGDVGWDFSSAVVIDASNDSLKVEIDGTESGTISLTQAAYASGEELASELETQINDDATLSAAGKSVEVQYDDATGIFGIFSVSTGTESSVVLTEITSGGIDIFGMTTSTAGVVGADAVGSTDDAAGLVLKITGNRTGDRGTVSYVEGIMAALDDFLDSILGADGTLTEREAGLLDEQEEIEEETEALDERMDAYEARLRAKFLYNDTIISTLNTTEDFLVQQFAALNGTNDD